MVRKLLGVILALALPAVLGAQTPDNASQPPTLPDEASARAHFVQANIAHGKNGAEEKAEHSHMGKATRRRGEVVRTEDKDRDRDDRPKKEDKDRDRDDPGRVGNPNAAKPAIPAVPTKGEGPAQKAIPAVPAHKSGGHP